MGPLQRTIGVLAVAVFSAAAAWLAVYVLIWFWLTVGEYEGEPSEAAREGFIILLAALVLGIAAGVGAGSGIVYGIERFDSMGPVLRRTVWVAAPLGAAVSLFLFLAGVL